MRFLSTLLVCFFASANAHGQVGAFAPGGGLQESKEQLQDAFPPGGNVITPGYSFNATPGFAPQVEAAVQQIAVPYLEKTPIEPVNGEQSSSPTRYKYRVIYAQLDVNCDLDKIELKGDGKRAAVQGITAARHKNLLQALKDAKSESDKVAAAKKLEENYRAHYAVETAWREERIAELEKRIEEMRSQVKERATSEDKYVEAAMTLAKLHAQGIATEPPKLEPAAAPIRTEATELLGQPMPPSLPEFPPSNVRY